MEKVRSELAISNLSPDTFEMLLKPNQISVVKKKFDEGISDLLEDAKRRKVISLNLYNFIYLLESVYQINYLNYSFFKFLLIYLKESLLFKRS